VESAETKSQAHLLAISYRKILAEPVTDILVERGDKQVVLSTAGNSGAVFSECGYATLVRRSSNDSDLAVCVWSRPEIPRQHLLKLFGGASEAVKRELTKEDPRKAGLIREVVAIAMNKIQSRARDKSAGFAAAHAYVQLLYDADTLGEPQLADLARSGKFDETIVALSIICDLPVGLIERAFAEEQSEQIIVMAKANGLSWDTTKAILLLQPEIQNGSKHELDRHFETFVRIKTGTAKKAIDFYRMRSRAEAEQHLS
jgi:uncharacterized protein (DUF2336 family)